MCICDECGRFFHLRCLVPPQTTPPSGPWICGGCDPLFSNLDELRHPQTPLSYRPHSCSPSSRAASTTSTCCPLCTANSCYTLPPPCNCTPHFLGFYLFTNVFDLLTPHLGSFAHLSSIGTTLSEFFMRPWAMLVFHRFCGCFTCTTTGAAFELMSSCLYAVAMLASARSLCCLSRQSSNSLAGTARCSMCTLTWLVLVPRVCPHDWCLTSSLTNFTARFGWC